MARLQHRLSREHDSQPRPWIHAPPLDLRIGWPTSRISQRLPGGAPAGCPVQRYRVGAPGTADCETVIRWLNAHSPYRPAWAKTSVRFSWTGTYTITGSALNFQVTIANPRVTVSKPVDMP